LPIPSSTAPPGHPNLAERLGDLGAALDCGEDLGVEPIDLVTHMVDVEFFGVQ